MSCTFTLNSTGYPMLLRAVVHSIISAIWELVRNVNSYTLCSRPTELQTLEGEASNLYFKSFR